MGKIYSCDGGTIMIGTKDFRICLPNGYGDGDFSVKIVKTEKQKAEFNKEYSKWNWLGSVEGTEINVYSYDCLHEDEIEDKENILYKLSGRYTVYCNNGKIVLEQW